MVYCDTLILGREKGQGDNMVIDIYNWTCAVPVAVAVVVVVMVLKYKKVK